MYPGNTFGHGETTIEMHKDIDHEVSWSGEPFWEDNPGGNGEWVDPVSHWVERGMDDSEQHWVRFGQGDDVNNIEWRFASIRLKPYKGATMIKERYYGDHVPPPPDDELAVGKLISCISTDVPAVSDENGEAVLLSFRNKPNEFEILNRAGNTWTIQDLGSGNKYTIMDQDLQPNFGENPGIEKPLSINEIEALENKISSLSEAQLHELTKGYINKVGDRHIQNNTGPDDVITATKRGYQYDSMKNYINPEIKKLGYRNDMQIVAVNDYFVEIWVGLSELPNGRESAAIVIKVGTEGYSLERGKLETVPSNVLPRLARVIKAVQKDLNSHTAKEASESIDEGDHIKEDSSAAAQLANGNTEEQSAETSMLGEIERNINTGEVTLFTHPIPNHPDLEKLPWSEPFPDGFQVCHVTVNYTLWAKQTDYEWDVTNVRVDSISEIETGIVIPYEGRTPHEVFVDSRKEL